MDVSLAVALVGVGGTLAGTALGSWQSRRHDMSRWFLDQRLHAYVTFAAAVTDLQTGWRHRADPTLALFNSAITDLANRRHELALLSPPATSAKADEVMVASQEVLARLTGVIKGKPTDAEAAMLRVWEAFKELIELQKADVAPPAPLRHGLLEKLRVLRHPRTPPEEAG